MPLEIEKDLKFRIIRWVVAFSLGSFILFMYYLLSRFNVYRFSHGEPYYTLFTIWDRYIPLIPETVWFYFLYYLVVMMPGFIVRNYQDLWEMCLAYFLVSLVGWLCWIFIPVKMEYPEISCDRFSCEVLKGLYLTDGGINIFPSLHVGHSTLAATFYVVRKAPLRSLMVFLAVLIAISTLTTRQHYLIDIPFGALLGVSGWFFTSRLMPYLREGYYTYIHPLIQREG
jgi:membrane-associated phospholipid phosphatase